MKEITRREIMKLFKASLAATGAAAIFGPALAYFYPPKLEETPVEPVLVGPAGDLPIGGTKTVPYGRYPALVLHTASGLKAYSAVCTHFACIVKWDAELGQIACPCHEGYFDAETGEVISGPPPSGLPVLKVQVIDGQVYVGGAE